MTIEGDLQHRSEIADARLGVAEELCWFVLILVVAVVQLKWDTWMGGIAAGAFSYYFFTLSYRRAAAKAEDEYFKAAHLGKYSKVGGADA